MIDLSTLLILLVQLVSDNDRPCQFDSQIIILNNY